MVIAAQLLFSGIQKLFENALVRVLILACLLFMGDAFVNPVVKNNPGRDRLTGIKHQLDDLQGFAIDEYFIA